MTTRIVVPSGVGDAYWCFTKMESMIEKGKISTPVVIYPWRPVFNNYDNHRGKEMVESIPWMEFGDYIIDNTILPHFRTGNPITPNITSVSQSNISEYDYFMHFNPLLERGTNMDDILPEYKTNWYIDMEYEKEDLLDPNEKYIVAFFTDYGMFKEWDRKFDKMEVGRLLYQIHKQTGYKIVLMGQSPQHDNYYTRLLGAMGGSLGSFTINMTGKTDFIGVLNLIRNAKLVIGHCAGGSTIFSTILKKPTIMYWDRDTFHNKGFWVNTCPPDSLNNWYFPFDIADAKSSVTRVLRIIKEIGI